MPRYDAAQTNESSRSARSVLQRAFTFLGFQNNTATEDIQNLTGIEAVKRGPGVLPPHPLSPLFLSLTSSGLGTRRSSRRRRIASCAAPPPSGSASRRQGCCPSRLCTRASPARRGASRCSGRRTSRSSASTPPSAARAPMRCLAPGGAVIFTQPCIFVVQNHKGSTQGGA